MPLLLHGMAYEVPPEVCPMQQFEHLKAAELHCPRCRQLRPVRERLLLILPYAELYEYRCTACGQSLAQREVKAPPLSAALPHGVPLPRPGPVPRRPPRPPRGLLR